jgi:hypothetical protein
MLNELTIKPLSYCIRDGVRRVTFDLQELKAFVKARSDGPFLIRDEAGRAFAIVHINSDVRRALIR